MTAALRGLRLTTRDVTLGGFFMEGARKNKARHPGFNIPPSDKKDPRTFCKNTADILLVLSK